MSGDYRIRTGVKLVEETECQVIHKIRTGELNE